MIDHKTDFFQIVDNFAKTASITSIPIIESKLRFTPKVIIAIPTYKRPKLLKEAINSALNQVGYSNYEIIVVDNDPDRNCETEKLLSTYTDKRISYFKNTENIGMTGNLNRIFSLSKSEWVVMLHDDDYIYSNFLIETMKIINKEKNVGLLKPLFKSTSTKIIRKLPKTIRIYDFDNFFGNKVGAPTGCIFNRNFVKELGGFNDEFYPCMDYYFLALFSRHYKTLKLNIELIYYRIENNTSLDVETIKCFFYNDYYFQTQLMRDFNIPKCFIRSCLSIRFLRLIKMYQNEFNKNFTLNIEDLGLTNNPNTFDKINYLIVYSYQIFLKILKQFRRDGK